MCNGFFFSKDLSVLGNEQLKDVQSDEVSVESIIIIKNFFRFLNYQFAYNVEFAVYFTMAFHVHEE